MNRFSMTILIILVILLVILAYINYGDYFGNYGSGYPKSYGYSKGHDYSRPYTKKPHNSEVSSDQNQLPPLPPMTETRDLRRYYEYDMSPKHGEGYFTTPMNVLYKNYWSYSDLNRYPYRYGGTVKYDKYPLRGYKYYPGWYYRDVGYLPAMIDKSLLG